MKKIQIDLSRYKPSTEKKRNVLPWQDYAATVCKDFNIMGPYKQIIFKYAKLNLEYLKGKVENTKEKFGTANLENKGNYLVSLFRKERPWDIKK